MLPLRDIACLVHLPDYGGRDFVVAPRRALRITGLVSFVLFRLNSRIVAPRMSDLIREPSFSLLDVADNCTKGYATPTSDRGGGGGQEESLDALTLNDDVLWKLLVDPTERDLKGLVVCLQVFKESATSADSFLPPNASSEGS